MLDKLFKHRKVSDNDLVLITTSLSYMKDAGLTLSDGVKILMADPNSKINRAGLQVLKDGFDEGLVLSEILKNNEKVFGAGLWRQMEAAERTGKVSECLLRIANQIKSGKDIMSKVKGAMVYPAFILVAALFAGYYLFTNTIPEMGAMMQEMDAELPALTLKMMAFCDTLTTHGILYAIALVVGIAVLVWILRGPLRLKWHKFITRAPLAGNISVDVNFSRVYLLLNDMIENGAHVAEALRVAGSSVGNLYIAMGVMGCAEMMEREGLSLTNALITLSTMPSNDKLMLDVGARTGREMEILKELSVRRSTAANESVARLLELMNPIVMAVVCVIVGVMVVSVYMPMLSMASTMG